jgi:selenide,water dikinase
MSRSQKLGHCICDPRKSCPCDLLLEKDVCLCAGERLDAGSTGKEAAPRLTALVKNAGCASKIPPAELARVLSRLPAISDPRLLVGAATADDAGVFQVSENLCLVQTVDVFTPSVDDPYIFGRIAACNSLSDVYAMGGKPLTALSIIGYPIHSLSEEWMYQMIRGGMDALEEAEVILAGGHSINDEEIKFGFSITGIINPKAIITNAGARPGDVLILTKPIGTGIIAFSAQLGRASEASKRAAAHSMTTLNQPAAEVMVEFGAHACTDVTGFGLLGHLYQMARESGVSVEVWWEAVPLLPEVVEYACGGLVSGAAERNREYAAKAVEEIAGVPEYALDILYDPQTSGGLLFALPAQSAEKVMGRLREAGCAQSAIIGRVTGASKGGIVVKQKPDEVRGSCCEPKTNAERGADARMASPAEHSCCAEEKPAGMATGGAQQAFQQFMSAAFAPGAIDVIQKELMTIALSVAVQCKPCLELHMKKALSMGIASEEINEAAWMGVVFGGCKAMMFWSEYSKNFGTTASPCQSKINSAETQS